MEKETVYTTMSTEIEGAGVTNLSDQDFGDNSKRSGDVYFRGRNCFATLAVVPNDGPKILAPQIRGALGFVRV